MVENEKWLTDVGPALWRLNRDQVMNRGRFGDGENFKCKMKDYSNRRVD